MDDGKIPKDMLFGDFATGHRPAGGPVLCYKNVCKGDMRSGYIDPAV